MKRSRGNRAIVLTCLLLGCTRQVELEEPLVLEALVRAGAGKRPIQVCEVTAGPREEDWEPDLLAKTLREAGLSAKEAEDLIASFETRNREPRTIVFADSIDIGVLLVPADGVAKRFADWIAGEGGREPCTHPQAHLVSRVGFSQSSKYALIYASESIGGGYWLFVRDGEAWSGPQRLFSWVA
jgi:hypothetical protein